MIQTAMAVSVALAALPLSARGQDFLPPLEKNVQVAAGQNGPDPVRERFRDSQARREAEFEVRIDLPGPERLFRRESEEEVFERIRQQERQAGGSGRVIFPEEVAISTEPYAPRCFPVCTLLVEPSYVCHGRLYFDQPNFERYGWDLGMLTPAINLGRFYTDVITMPYQMGTRPTEHYDCSAGKYLPGDPTPLYLYPPEFSLTGLVFQAGAFIGGAFAFP